MISPIGKNGTKEFLLLTASALIPALIWLYVPPLAVVAAFVIPVPVAILVMRMDTRYALGTVAVIVVLLTVISGRPHTALLIAMETGPLGLLLGLLFKNRVSSGRSMAVAAVFSLVIAAGVLLSGYLITGESPFVLNERQKYIFDQERLLFDQMLGQTGGMDQSSVRELEQVINRVEAMWPVISLSMTLTWFLVLSFVSYWFTRLVLGRLGYKLPAVRPFTRWRLPWYAIWGIIAGLLLMLAGDYRQVAGLAVTGKALLWAAAFVFAVIGMSVAGFFFKRWGASSPIKVIGVVILVIYLPLSAVMLAIGGITDTILNIRRLSPGGQTPEEEERK